MVIRGTETLTPAELERALAAGTRCVVFEYCVSAVLVTARRSSRVYLLRPEEHGLWRALPYALVSLLVGWWGIPWGVVCTPLALISNFSGGRDVTPILRERMRLTAEPGPSPDSEH